MVAEGGVEPPSLDYQSSALSLSYTAAVVFDLRPSVFDRPVTSMNRGPKTNVVVDPTGLKPAPHGLKGRCSVTRAPDQDIYHLSLTQCSEMTIDKFEMTN